MTDCFCKEIYPNFLNGKSERLKLIQIKCAYTLQLLHFIEFNCTLNTLYDPQEDVGCTSIKRLQLTVVTVLVYENFQLTSNVVLISIHMNCTVVQWLYLKNDSVNALCGLSRGGGSKRRESYVKNFFLKYW